MRRVFGLPPSQGNAAAVVRSLLKLFLQKLAMVQLMNLSMSQRGLLLVNKYEKTVERVPTWSYHDDLCVNFRFMREELHFLLFYNSSGCLNGRRQV